MKLLLSALILLVLCSCELHEQSAYLNTVGDEATFNLEKVDTLFAAVINNDYELLEKELLKDRSFININNDQGQILITESVRLKRRLLVALLLSHGADVKLKDQNGDDVYKIVDSYDDKDVWIDLFNTGNSQGQYLNDGLINLVTSGAHDNQEITIMFIKLYIAKGADINIRNNRKYTILTIAASKNLSKLVEYLCERGDIDINAKVGRYTTLGLIEKLIRRNPELVTIKELLVSYGAI